MHLIMILKRYERHFYLPYHKYYATETVWETFLSTVSQVLWYWSGMRDISIYRITSIVILKQYERHFYLPYHKYYDTETVWETFLSTVSQVLWYWNGMRDISIYRITSIMILKRYERHFYLPYHKYHDTETIRETFLSTVSQVVWYWSGMRDISICRITSIMILKRYERHFYLPYHKYYATETVLDTFLSTVSQVLWYWSGMRHISIYHITSIMILKRHEGHFYLPYHTYCDTETVWETFLSTVSQVLWYWSSMRDISIYRITITMILKRHETHFYLPYHKYYDTEAAWETFLSTVSHVLWYWSGMRDISVYRIASTGYYDIEAVWGTFLSTVSQVLWYWSGMKDIFIYRITSIMILKRYERQFYLPYHK
jgi:virulence-associated protein VapD